MRRILALALMLLVVLAGLAALALPTDAQAKGKPPCKQCPARVGPCVLVSCGDFDCVYQCPIPEP